MTRKPITLLAAIIVAFGTVPAHAESQGESNTLEAIDHGIMSGGRIVIRATFEKPLGESPAVFRSYHPRQHIVLDFPNTRSELKEESRDLDFRGVSGIDIAEARDRTRVTVGLDDPRVHEITLKGNELWLTLTPLVQVAPAAVSGRFELMIP